MGEMYYACVRKNGAKGRERLMIYAWLKCAFSAWKCHIKSRRHAFLNIRRQGVHLKTTLWPEVTCCQQQICSLGRPDFWKKICLTFFRLLLESIQGVSDCKVNTDTYMWVFCELNASQLTKHPLHANSSALAAYIGVNYRIPEWTFWTWKFYKCFSKPGGKFYFWKKCWIPRVSWFYFAFQEISSKKFFK